MKANSARTDLHLKRYQTIAAEPTRRLEVTSWLGQDYVIAPRIDMLRDEFTPWQYASLHSSVSNDSAIPSKRLERLRAFVRATFRRRSV